MNAELSWTTTEYSYKKKGSDWYIALGVLCVSFATAAYIFNNSLLGILILVAGFTVALYGSKKPTPLHCLLTHRGVQINELLYPYSTLKAFWINELKDPAVIMFHSKKVFAPYISLRLPRDINIQELRGELKAVLTEEEMSEPVANALFDRLGF